MHDKEKQSREQMKMVYNTIIEKGLAKEDHILVVRGRGKELVSSSPSNDFVTNGGSFKMYGPVYSQQGGFTFGGPTPSGVPLPSARDNGNEANTVEPLNNGRIGDQSLSITGRSLLGG